MKRRLTMLVAFISAWCLPFEAMACEVCYGAGEGPLLDGARAGVLLMLGITLFVLASFATFFLRLRARILSAEGAIPSQLEA